MDKDVDVGVIMAGHLVRDSALRLQKLVESKGGVSEINSACIHYRFSKPGLELNKICLLFVWWHAI